MTDFRISNTRFDTSKLIKLSTLTIPFNRHLKQKNVRPWNIKKHKVFLVPMYVNVRHYLKVLLRLLPLTLWSKFSKDQ